MVLPKGKDMKSKEDGFWDGCASINVLSGIEAVRKRPGLYIGTQGRGNALVQEAVKFGRNFGEVRVSVSTSEEDGDWVQVQFNVRPEVLEEMKEPEGEGTDVFRKLVYLLSEVVIPSTFVGTFNCIPFMIPALSAVCEISYTGDPWIEVMRWGTEFSGMKYSRIQGIGERGVVKIRFSPNMSLVREPIDVEELRRELDDMGVLLEKGS